jgi:hypothetical protein
LWVQTWPKQWIFKGNKNLQHIFLLRVSKATGNMSQDFMACNESLASMNKSTFQGRILIPFAQSLRLLPDSITGRIARELWWMNQEFSSVNIIIIITPPRFSMLILSPGG